MKLIQVNLAALTRVEWSALVEVPDTFSEDDLHEVVRRFYHEIDGGEFQDDPEYWERGECWADENLTVRDDDKPSFRVSPDLTITDLVAVPQA